MSNLDQNNDVSPENDETDGISERQLVRLKRNKKRDAAKRDKESRAAQNRDGKSGTQGLMPDLVLVGFQEGASRSDLNVYLRSKAAEIGDPDNCHYQMIKKDGGFYWEIHDSGSGHGCLKSILKGLETKSELIVPTSRRWLRVIKNKNNGISAFLVNEDEKHERSPEVAYEDSMKSMSSKGTGFLVFGSVLAIIGTLSFTTTYFYKYGMLDKQEEVELAPVSMDFPYLQYDKMKNILSMDNGTYIDSVIYNSSTDSYLIKTKKEEIVNVSIEPGSISNPDSMNNETPPLPEELLDGLIDNNDNGAK